MENRRSRLLEDLAGIFRGELRSDPISLAVYRGRIVKPRASPWAIASPRDAADLKTLIQFAAGEHLKLAVRGQGTSFPLLPDAFDILVDVTRFARDLEFVQSATGSTMLRVGAGATLGQIRAFLKPIGRRIAFDSWFAEAATVGGLFSTDAAGPMGRFVNVVRDVSFVTGKGDVFSANPLRDVNGDPTGASPPGIRRLQRLLHTSAREAPPAGQPLSMDSPVNFQRWLCGAMGELGVCTEFVLDAVALPEEESSVVFLFRTLDDAVLAVKQLSLLKLTSFSLMDRRCWTRARERFEPWKSRSADSPDLELALILRVCGESAANTIQAAITRISHLCAHPTVVEGVTHANGLWGALRESVASLIAQAESPAAWQQFREIAVNRDALAETLRNGQKWLQRFHSASWWLWDGHAGRLKLFPLASGNSLLISGHSRENPRGEIPLESSSLWNAASLTDSAAQSPVAETSHPVVHPTNGGTHRFSRELLEEFGTLLQSAGGELLAPPGFDLPKTCVEKPGDGSKSPGALYRELKSLLDPHQILPNSSERSARPQNTSTEPLDSQETADATAPLIELQWNWTAAEARQELATCNACGRCAVDQPDSRMCPLHRVDPGELSAPRSKAALFEQWQAGMIDTPELESRPFRELLKTCFHCKQCSRECPSSARIPELALELRAQHVAARGLTRSTWFLAHPEKWGRWACRFSSLLNPLLNQPIARRILEWLWEIARERKLPPLARVPFLDQVRNRRPLHSRTETPRDNRPHQRVVVFVDHYVNYHDPQLGQALVRILEHNHCDVEIPPQQTVSGFALMVAGDVEAAREIANQNIRMLTGYARDGWWIVCPEPATAIALQQEYPRLVDDPDVDLVASRTREAGQFLRQLHDARELRTDWGPVPLECVYHTPCHVRALGGESSLVELCKLIPRCQIRKIERGCSGIAGVFGLQSPNYQTAQAIGEELRTTVRNGSWTVGLTECSSCKLQMEHDTTKPTIHPLKLLALAYGLMPELQRKLLPNPRRWLAS